MKWHDARIQVGFCLELHDLVKVREVNVPVHTEEALEDVLDRRLEGLGERHRCTDKQSGNSRKQPTTPTGMSTAKRSGSSGVMTELVNGTPT